MNKKGFTIIELVIVITVLAILIGITVPKMKGMQDSAKVVKAKKELQTIQSAIESYYTFNAVYPGDISASLVNTTPQILTQAMTDPFSTYSAAYQYVQSGQYYAIFSIGVDRAGSVTGFTGSQVQKSGLGVICVTNGSGC